MHKGQIETLTIMTCQIHSILLVSCGNYRLRHQRGVESVYIGITRSGHFHPQ